MVSTEAFASAGTTSAFLLIFGPRDSKFRTWAAKTHHEMQCFLATTEGLQIHTTFEVGDFGGLGIEAGK
ncbi:MAG: hypothetical protein ABR880_19415 [Candidatus Sulfotelmatobacter sp.]|jgi:hypothetical protein